MTRPLKIANASAFWGDDPSAAPRTLEQAPDLDYITLDYLAEVSMSILARQRQKDPQLGYAPDFLDVVRSLVSSWRTGRRARIVTNAGGLNPEGCARAVQLILREHGLTGLRVAFVTGDDVMGWIHMDRPASDAPVHLETGKPPWLYGPLITANAYVGAAPVADALRAGADIIITGRVADPSLTVAPCIAHFGWSREDYSRLAGATVGGHLIECGTQVTGGIATDWLEVPDPARIGFPVVEVSADGSCVVSKPPGTGGRVSEDTVKEQLLYEIGDPARYLSPDATVDFTTLRVDDLGNNRVRISGATGCAPPPAYKVSATYLAGYRATGSLVIIGRDAIAKARRAAESIRQRLADSGHPPQQFHAECIGSGDANGGLLGRRDDLMETVLRIAAFDHRREPVEAFSRLLVPLVTAGPQGTTGYFDGRPQVREVFGYFPTLIPRDQVHPRAEVLP